MPRMEMRKPIDALMTEKAKIDQKLTEFKDKYELLSAKLQELRASQFHFREGKAALSNSNMNNPAKKVFDQQISTAQKEIEETLKSIDELEKDRTVWTSKGNAMLKSIKELQNS